MATKKTRASKNNVPAANSIAMQNRFIILKSNLFTDADSSHTLLFPATAKKQTRGSSSFDLAFSR
jgi:hypothetical protein